MIVNSLEWHDIACRSAILIDDMGLLCHEAGARGTIWSSTFIMTWMLYEYAFIRPVYDNKNFGENDRKCVT